MDDARVTVHEVCNALLLNMCCKHGCPKKTASACFKELEEVVGFCPCPCHRAWELLDTLEFQAERHP